MGNRVKSSKLVYFLVFSVSSSSIVGCGYHPFRADKKYYKYQPTLLDRVWARSMVMTKDDNIEKSVEKIRDFIKPGKEGEVKKALRELVDSENKEKKKDELIKACTDKIKIHIQTVNLKPEDQIIEENIKPVLNDLIKYEEKEYAVNGMKFKVKDNSIEFTGLGVSVPLKDVKVTDADVIGFSSDIQKALRARMDFGRRVRLGSGTVQILAAAAGATLGLITKDVTTAAALAAVSAVIPELQNIFQARDRLEHTKMDLHYSRTLRRVITRK
ncbi:MAG: hypothetical protein BROFUL_00835 [Candidatus Brocadia fulgida]|uniref:Lipoprotein n=1 Tax=Candidatus Brocadia fulgida TaxID=380242 RepID=A0A0M2UY07_9BACT|nr:MAG: hypothetical protein BROFUL_00835 [Candidatus Brocadia fulgida]